MNHNCKYCNDEIKPCPQPCLDASRDVNHICCTCGTEIKCELPYSTVDDKGNTISNLICSKEKCNLKFMADFYKSNWAQTQSELTHANESIINIFRIIGIDSKNFKSLIQTKGLDVTGMKVFWSKKVPTWDEHFDLELGYMFMCFLEEGYKKAAEWVGQRNLRVNIKKDLIEKTNKDLKDAEKLRNKEILDDQYKHENKTVRVLLNSLEKVVYAYMKGPLKLSQKDAEEIVRSMPGMVGECRNLKGLGLKGI